jgi:hypothetical protein
MTGSTIRLPDEEKRTELGLITEEGVDSFWSVGSARFTSPIPF